MAKTSWCDMLAAVAEAMMNGDVEGVQTVSKGDKSITYRSWSELERKYHWVEARCNEEMGLKVRRTYARNAGRG